MNYPVIIAGFEDQRIEVQAAGFFAGPRLLVNGQPAPKGPKRGQMLLRRSDGAEIVATWKTMWFDVPQLVVEGKTIAAVTPLKWYEWVWSGLPILLIFAGGALGALVGCVGLWFNLKVFRSQTSGFARYGLTAMISILAVVVWLALVMVLSLLLGQ